MNKLALCSLLAITAGTVTQLFSMPEEAYVMDVRQDVLDDADVLYGLRHLYDRDVVAPVQDEEDYGLRALFGDLSRTEQIGAFFGKSAVKASGAVAVTALAAAAVYKCVRALQAKKANNVCDECANA